VTYTEKDTQSLSVIPGRGVTFVLGPFCFHLYGKVTSRIVKTIIDGSSGSLFMSLSNWAQLMITCLSCPLNYWNNGKRLPAPYLLCHRPLSVPLVQLKNLFRASPAFMPFRVLVNAYSPEKMHAFRFPGDRLQG